MKHTTLLIISFVLSTILFGQSHTTDVEYKKINHEAIVNDIPFPENIVAGAIKDKMEKIGYKGKNTKNFTVYSGVRMPELGNDSYDLYFMTDRKSRKEKETTVVTLLLSKGLENFITDSSDVTVINNAKTYLDNIKVMIAAYDLEQQIIDQEDFVKKTDKKLANLKGDGVDMEKKKKKLEQQIEDNKKNQLDQQGELERQRQILETLRGKRKQ